MPLIHMDKPLLFVDGLTVSFKPQSSKVKSPLIALRDVCFAVPKGKTVALVGESGCGKSLTARAVLRILPETAKIDSGRLDIADIDVAALKEGDQRLGHIRGGKIGMIYQEPMSAFSHYYTIGNQIEETIRQHLPLGHKEARARAIDMLDAVGIPAAAERIDAYSFELSGGQLQRAMIAMALSTEPDLLIADEPTTALDVTTQATTLALLRGLQRERDMSMLFITHDLGVVAEIADEAVVMYLGEVVERGPVSQLLSAPKHPYTRALIASAPRPGRGRLATIEALVHG